MRRQFASLTAPRQWRGRRRARMAVAAALVVAAPLVGRADPAPQVDPAQRDSPPGDVAASMWSAGAGQPAGSDPPDGAPNGAPGRDVGLRVVPVPLADPSVADVLIPGVLVDLVATVAGPDPSSSPAPELVAQAARVRDIPTGRTGSRSILVEVPEADAARLASTAAGTPLAVVVHG